jgi:hypothetical protein
MSDLVSWEKASDEERVRRVTEANTYARQIWEEEWNNFSKWASTVGIPPNLVFDEEFSGPYGTDLVFLCGPIVTKLTLCDPERARRIRRQ